MICTLFPGLRLQRILTTIMFILGSVTSIALLRPPPIQADPTQSAVRLLQNEAIDSAAITPDGNTVVFVHSTTRQLKTLYSMPFAGGERIALTTPFALYDVISFDLHPDGKRVLVSTRLRSQYEIYTIRIDGTERIDLAPLISDLGRLRKKSISPDGHFLVWQIRGEQFYEEFGYLGTDLFVMPLDGQSPPRRLSAPRTGSSIDEWKFSPTGASVLYFERDDYNTREVRLYNAPLYRGPVVLIDQFITPYYGSYVVSDDGLFVIYERYGPKPDYERTLYVSPTTVSAPTKVPLPPDGKIGSIYQVRFTADNRRIIYTMRSDTRPGVFNVPRDGRGPIIELTSSLPDPVKTPWFKLSKDKQEVLIEYSYDDDWAHRAFLNVGIQGEDPVQRTLPPAIGYSREMWITPNTHAIILFLNDQFLEAPRMGGSLLLLSDQVSNINYYRMQFVGAADHLLFSGIAADTGEQALFLTPSDHTSSLVRLSGTLRFGENDLYGFQADASGSRVIFWGVRDPALDTPALFAVETGLPPQPVLLHLPLVAVD